MQIRSTLKTVALALAIMAFVAPAVFAQQDFHTRDASKTSTKKEAKDAPAPMFPKATRAEPDAALSEKQGKPINDLLALVNVRGHEDEVIATGEHLAASPDAKHYEHALIYQAMGYAYLNKGDNPKGIEYLQKSLAEDALSNNDQYELMLLLAKQQIAAGQPDAGLATLDRVIAETKQDKPEYNGIRGRVLYARKDYAAAAQAFQKALDGSTQPDPVVQQMLMASYFQLKQPERAEKIGEDILHAHPNDKDAIANLATIYQQAGQSDKAAALLEDARKRGLLANADGYRALYVLYSKIKGRENDGIAVINEGLQKGILQPNAEVYTALADDYYFSGQIPQAIDAYKKADAVSTDGEAALDLAKIHHNQGQASEARAEAERALQKGIKHPDDAHVIIDHAGTAPRKPAKKK